MASSSKHDDPFDGHENGGPAERSIASSDVIARAKALLADRDFPNDRVVAEVARVLARREFHGRDDRNRRSHPPGAGDPVVR